MDLNDIKLGRVILFHGNAGISRKIQQLTKSHWNHVGIYVGHGDIREACFKGVVRTPLTHYLEGGGEMMIVKLKAATDEDHIGFAIRSGDYHGKGYGFVQLFLILWVLKKKNNWFAREILLLWNKFVKRLICSEYIAKIVADEWFQAVSGIDLAEVMPCHFDPEVNPKWEEEIRRKECKRFGREYYKSGYAIPESQRKGA